MGSTPTGVASERTGLLGKAAIQSERGEIEWASKLLQKIRSFSKTALSSCRESVFEFYPGRVKRLRVEVLNIMKRLR